MKRKIKKVGVISACWEYAAYDAETGDLIGYFYDQTSEISPLIVSAVGRLSVLGPDDYEVVEVNEKAWD